MAEPPAMPPPPFVSYARNGEDVMLWRAFDPIPDGFYVDVGAARPDEDSVTRAFYDRGWHGLNLAPTLDQAATLARARPRDTTLALQPPLRAILAGHAPPDIHFLRIAAPGDEAAVLQASDLHQHRPRIVLVETTPPASPHQAHHEAPRQAPHQAWEPLLLQAAYRFAIFDGLNRFYLADEWAAALAPHFQTPVNARDGFVRVAEASWARRAAEQQRDAAHAAARARAAEQGAEAAYARAFEAARAAGADRTRREVADQARDEALRLRLAADAWGEACNARTEAAEALARAWQERALRAEAAAAATAAAEAAAAQDAHHLKALLDATHRSTSWRLTRPLRALMTRLRPPPPPPAPKPEQGRDLQPAPPPQPAPPRPPVATPQPVTTPEPPPTPIPHHPTPHHPVPHHPVQAVHQFHSGSATGDAVTNCLLLVRHHLRTLGYRSEIFVQHRDPALEAEIRTLDELPRHPDHVLIVHHSMGHDGLDRILATPARKILYFHNITPPELLPDIPSLRRRAEQGRHQLATLRDNVAAALTPSDYSALELRRLGFANVRTANLLFDLEALQARATPTPLPDDHPFTVLFVGRVIESKAQADLVDAFAAFRTRLGRPARLVLVGRIDTPGTYLEQVARRIEAHRLAAAVTITGPIPDDTLDAHFATADLYVSLSRHEGFGVPLVEAMARNIPVLAAPTGAVPFVLGPQGPHQGLLEDPTPEAVATRMLALATDPARRAALVSAQNATLGRHALAHHWPTLHAALADAGAAPPPDPHTRRTLAPLLRFAVTGHAQGTYSLAAINRGIAAAIEAERPGRVRLVPVETVPTTDLSVLPEPARALAERAPPRTGPEITLVQHYPILNPQHRGDLALALVFWEESLLPPDMVAALSAFDGVLAPTAFVAKALVDSGVSRPVRIVGQAPDLAPFQALALQRQPRPGPFTFLHVSSCFPRKGVDVLLKAYARAFRAHHAVHLVIKAFPNPHNTVADQVAALRAADPGMAPIQVIDQDLDPQALHHLYSTADAMVLPTRGEGLNLPAAEAMAAGIPLIVTGHGGHMDFCDENTARLLAYRMAPSGSHLNSAASLWAEPDEDDLVAALHEAVAAGQGPGAPSARTAAARVQVARRLARRTFVERLESTALDLLLRQPPAPIRIAWITSWAVRCGVAEYTRHLLQAMQPNPAIAHHLVLSDDRPPQPDPTPPNPHTPAIPTWQAGNDASLADLKATIAREDPAIVVIQHQAGLITWPGLIDLLAAPTLATRQIVVTLHHTRDIPSLEPTLRTPLLAALATLARIIVHTVEDIRRLHELGLGAQAMLVPHGVRPALPPSTAAPLDAAPLIGCYGFFLPGKGIPELIAALALLRHARPQARLLLVNAEYDSPLSAAEIARCRDEAAAAGLADAVEWHTSFLPDAGSLALLARCDAIAIPTQASMEASSAAVRTAMAAGPPVMVTPLPLFDDVAQAVARSPGTAPADLAAGLERLLADPAARTRIQTRAQAWMHAHAWPAIAARTQGALLGLRAAAMPRQRDNP